MEAGVANWSTTSRWRRLRLVILERDGYQCQIGGPKCKRKADEVDHIIPVDDGGPIYDPANLRAACNWCNVWRAQKQKSAHGWKRSKTHIVLVVGPIAAGKSSYVNEHAGPDDLVVDYDAISRALGPVLPQGHGGMRHKLVSEVRNRLLRQIQRGEAPVSRAWILSCNPDAEVIFPHHEVRVIDPGRDEVLRRCAVERPESLWGTVDEWYEKRQASAVREW